MDGRKHSEQTRARVLEAIRECGRVDMACKSCKVNRTAFYSWVKKDEAYAAEFREATDVATQLLEDEAFRRARDGVRRPVTVAGKQVMVQEYSDSVLTFLLKGRMPKRYGDRIAQEFSGPDGAPLNVTINVQGVKTGS